MITILVPEPKWPSYIINPPLYCLARLAATARGSTIESASLTRCLGTNIPLVPRYPTKIFHLKLGFGVPLSLTRSSSWLSSISVHKEGTEIPYSCIRRSIVLELTCSNSATNFKPCF